MSVRLVLYESDEHMETFHSGASHNDSMSSGQCDDSEKTSIEPTEGTWG